MSKKVWREITPMEPTPPAIKEVEELLGIPDKFEWVKEQAELYKQRVWNKRLRNNPIIINKSK